MPFTLETRHKILTVLNLALLRSHQLRSNYDNYSGEFYNMNAVLSPTEYQANRPRPLMFEKNEIWSRLGKIEAESEFLVQQVQEVVEDCDRLEKSLKAIRGSTSYALKRADVLEYDVTLKTAGIEEERDIAIEKLRYFLDLPPSPTVEAGGGATGRS
jgi:hypothetical protein